jgi:hypothetical protein
MSKIRPGGYVVGKRAPKHRRHKLSRSLGLADLIFKNGCVRCQSCETVLEDIRGSTQAEQQRWAQHIGLEAQSLGWREVAGTVICPRCLKRL